MKLPETIGIAGTNGSGKDTLAELRHKKQGARIASLSDILRTEATRRGLEHTRENLSDISTQWGRELGAGALSLMTLRDFWATRTEGETGLSIVSIRRPDEAEAVQENKGVIVWVDADRELRYNRVTRRLDGRVDDSVSYEEFSLREDLEMNPDNDDPFALNMSAVRDLADIHIDNRFASRAAYEAALVDRFELD